MAKKATVQKEMRKNKLVEKYAKKRLEIKKRIKSSQDPEQIDQAILELEQLPVNSSATRLTKRCVQCGRPHAVYRKFGLCRICLRNQLMAGNVTGARKSSW